jgi:hypothetical protein
MGKFEFAAVERIAGFDAVDHDQGVIGFRSAQANLCKRPRWAGLIDGEARQIKQQVTEERLLTFDQILRVENVNRTANGEPLLGQTAGCDNNFVLDDWRRGLPRGGQREQDRRKGGRR